MNDIEYYKSLISDEEVIKALIKESKERDGELPKEKTRVRPNINFFQRTVTNLVSSNRRISSKQEEFAPRERKKCDRKIKTPHTLMREILLSNKTHFVKSEENSNSTKLKENLKNYIERKRNKIRELKQKQSKQRSKASQKIEIINLSQNLDDGKVNDVACTSISSTLLQIDKRARRSSDSSDISIVSISSSEDSSRSTVIKLSDSEPESNEDEETCPKGSNVCELNNIRKPKKKRKI